MNGGMRGLMSWCWHKLVSKMLGRMPGVLCVIQYQDSVYLVQTHFGDEGVLQLVGGLRRWREKPFEAMKRELEEELGISRSLLVPLGRERVHHRTIDFFACRLRSRDVRILSSEIKDGRWFDPGDQILVGPGAERGLELVDFKGELRHAA